MDTIYKGLAAPQRSFALGCPEIPEAERPGAILSSLALDALRAGAFEPRRVPARAGTPTAEASRAPSGWSPSLADRRDFGAFDDEPEGPSLGH